ncbi:uncharacterized protein LOC135343851 [Halichondria panicea]|uniref:uncharacterized protein LOC135343851 n=1 Tax=Halichondria panicea TaxID=6063 RepID=UPI00312B552E
MISLSIWILGTILLTCRAQELYVTPTLTACPSGVANCHTLDYYAINGSSLWFGKENVSLIFLEGNHTSNKRFQVLGSHLLTVKSSGDTDSVFVFYVDFWAFALDRLVIENLNFVNCDLHLHCYGSMVGMKETNLRNSYIHIQSQNDGVQLVELKELTTDYISRPFEIDLYNHTVLTISNCIFQQPISVRTLVNNERIFIKASVIDSTFRSINVYSALQFSRYTNLTVAEEFEGSLTLENVSFIDNTATGLEIQQPMDVIINGSKFINNSGLLGGAINVSDSRLFFVGDNLFLNNSGSNGGAIHLSNSIIWLEEDSNITFQENRASEIGGAISNEAQNSCFYSLTFDVDKESTSIPVSIKFRKNTALAGRDIYGAGLQNDCKVTPNGTVYSCDIQNSVFKFINRTLSSVSTSAKRVCLCENGVPQCANIDYIFYNISAAPGEKFNLSVVLVGEDFGSNPGGVYASSIKQSTTDSCFTFGSRRSLQLSEAKYSDNCSLLEYSIEPKHKSTRSVSFILSRDRVEASKHQEALTTLDTVRTELESSILLYNDSGCIDNNLLNAAVVINVIVLPCPRGFILSEKNICICDPQLNSSVEYCNVKNKTGLLYRYRNVWIGRPNINKNDSDVILVHSFCPFDYCNSNPVGVDLNNPDSQCALSHSGVLCGGCLPEVSVWLSAALDVRIVLTKMITSLF